MRVVEGSLSEFQKLMDKLQTRLEGEAAPEVVVRAVITCLQVPSYRVLTSRG